jgi:hypothetical protein
LFPLSSVERGTYRLVAKVIREARRNLEKQGKEGVAVDTAQFALLAHLADRAQAVFMGEEQPDLFTRK